jgi:hypothetical protein
MTDRGERQWLELILRFNIQLRMKGEEKGKNRRGRTQLATIFNISTEYQSAIEMLPNLK